jgi:hypothetical protein
LFDSGEDQYQAVANMAVKLQTNQKKKNSVAFSPQANYADGATATCRRNLVLTFADRGVSRGQRGGSPTVVNLKFYRPAVKFQASRNTQFIYQFSDFWALRRTLLHGVRA